MGNTIAISTKPSSQKKEYFFYSLCCYVKKGKLLNHAVYERVVELFVLAMKYEYTMVLIVVLVMIVDRLRVICMRVLMS